MEGKKKIKCLINSITYIQLGSLFPNAKAKSQLI